VKEKTCSSGSQVSYSSSGVDIAKADAAKFKMAESLKTKNPRVLNSLGAFASLYDGDFSSYKQPVLVLKMEEPGSKQKLAFQYGYIPSLCRDLVNHLVNDIAVMGADPHAVQDVIVCGKLEPEIVTELVREMALACREQDCELVGGETSEQPGVLEAGLYVLAASIVGVVEKSKILDGSKTESNDVIFAVASNGLHTNGYSLARKLLELNPELKDELVQGQRFLDLLMKPHTPYLNVIRSIRDLPGMKGFAHITGGGIEGNLNRIIPEGLCAKIEAANIKVLPIFEKIQSAGSVPLTDMRKTFNMGVGLVGICSKDTLASVLENCNKAGIDAYAIGYIETAVLAEDSRQVRYIDSL
jgi:phosphoribosylformylglycinamidine cyclo-ligase